MPSRKLWLNVASAGLAAVARHPAQRAGVDEGALPRHGHGGSVAQHHGPAATAAPARATGASNGTACGAGTANITAS